MKTRSTFFSKFLSKGRSCVFLCLALSSCATYQNKVHDSRLLLEQGQYEQAIEKLKPLAEKADGDQLVYLLDYATALQMSGRYDESNRAFLKADQLSEALDYHSVTRITGAALTGEEAVQYKGDTFERTFINAFLALNFLQMGKLDDALVEARRINEKYLKLRGEDKKSYELNPFAKYLSALIWEADQKWDDAYIAYQEAYKLDPSIPSLREDLIRSAKRAQRETDLAKWKKEFPDIKEDPLWSNRKAGELVIIYLQGWGPRKQPSEASFRIPTLRAVPSHTQSLKLQISGLDKKIEEKSSRLVYNVNDAAIATLQDDAAALIARRIGSAIVKDQVAQEIRKKNELLGALALVAMHVSDRADLRQWSTMPATIQVIRKTLPPGKYDFSLQGLSYGDQPTADRLENQSVEIKSNRKKFILFRTLR